MLPLTCSSSRVRVAALGLTLGLAGPAVHAGFLNASAAQNPFDLRTDSSLSADRVSASFGQASASATRTRVESSADGAGTLPQNGFEASAGNSATYTLWDAGANAPFSLAGVQSVNLVFNFSLTGFLEVMPEEKAAASTRYLVGVGNGKPQSLEGSVGGAYAEDERGLRLLLYVGDTELVGSYTLGFAIPVSHTNSAAGSFAMIVANTAGVSAKAYSTMTLESVVGGAVNIESLRSRSADPSSPMSIPSLAVRINETGLIIPVVSAVPEPGAATLALLGLFSLMGWRRWVQRR